MGDDENAAGRRLGGAYVKRLRMLGTKHADVPELRSRTRRKKPEARQMRVCRASTGGHTGGQGPTRANQTYLILIVCPI
jgi:hypothetical protein